MAHDTMHGRCSCNGFAHVALDSVAQRHGPVRRSSLPCVTRGGTSIFGDFPKCSETKSDCLKQLDPVITVTSSFAYQYGERMRSATIHNGFSAGLNVSSTGRLDCVEAQCSTVLLLESPGTMLPSLGSWRILS